MTFTHPFWKRVLATIFLVSVFLGLTQINKTYGSSVAFCIYVFLFIIPFINTFTRLYAWSKPFVSSKYNVYTAKYRRNLIINLPSEIAYGKFIEVLENSSFVLDQTNDTTLEIFVYKKSSWDSTGENMYIQFEADGKASRMKILAVSFRFFDQEKNHQNIIELINEFENSLTI